MLPLLPDRRLRRIFLLSLALHGILLTLLPDALFQRESISAAKEMQAMLVTAAASRPVPAAEEHPLPAPRLVASHHPLAILRETPRKVSPAPLPVLPVNEGARRAEAMVATSSTNSAPMAPSAVQPSAEPPADGLREYRLALGREARRFKQEFDRKYEAMERERQRGWEGRVEMTVRSQAGLVPAVVLAHSSGFPPLDEQALEMMGRAVRQTALPPSLQGHSFSMPVMLEFRIRKE